MKKQNYTNLVSEIEQKTIGYLKAIVNLNHNIKNIEIKKDDDEKKFALDLIAVLDSFETKFDAYEEKIRNNELSEDSKKIIDSFKTISRKVSRILESYNIQEIKFDDGKIKPGLCNIIETKPDPQKENETILILLKKGYTIRDKVIRKAEVITVRN